MYLGHSVNVPVAAVEYGIPWRVSGISKSGVTEASGVASSHETAAKAKIIICTSTKIISGAYVDDVKVVKGTATAKGVFSGKLPEKLPEIKEEGTDVEVVDDGYEYGKAFYTLCKSYEQLGCCGSLSCLPASY